MAGKKGRTEEEAGAPLDEFVKTRCRCGEQVYMARIDAGKMQTCPKCDEQFRVGITRDSRGREQVIATFTVRERRSPAPQPSPTPKPKVRVNEVAPIVPERPKEPTRDGKFVLDMTGDVSARPAAKKPKAQPVPSRGGAFEKAEFKAEDPFKPARVPAPAPAPGAKPYSGKRETMPGVMYTTCPCGEPALVRREFVGERMMCPACRRVLRVDVVRDPETKELVIHLKPV